MSEPFLAEVKMVGFNFAPRGWAFCDGQILPINQNQSLYSLLGTTYGGDGRTTFALPDLRGRTPIHEGDGHSLGQKSGAETITLTTPQIPPHNHLFPVGELEGDSEDPAGRYLADGVATMYSSENANNLMNQGSISKTGGSQAHNNMQPFLTLNFCIALRGLFPSRN